MRLDEMIIKANADGKTYTNSEGDITYSKNVGFLDCEGETLYPSCSLLFEGWQENPKRHLTVSEAEKELDCVIDTPDISKLLRSSKNPPDNRGNVIVVSLEQCDDPDGNYTGYHSKGVGWFVWKPDSECGAWEKCEPICWIDPEDLTKLLPKE